MIKSNLMTRTLVAAASCLAMGSVSASLATWTDWTAISATSATGTMGGIAVTATTNGGTVINGPSQTGCGTNYWTGTAYTNGSLSNGPMACDMVALNSAVSITVTFSSAVDNLYMALLSVGQPGYKVTYDFNRSFSIDSEGDGYWGNDVTNGVLGAGTLGGGSLTMQEFHGVLRFAAPVTSLTFTTDPGEYWHAFTFGTIPEPGTLALVGAAMLAAGALSRRKHAA